MIHPSISSKGVLMSSLFIVFNSIHPSNISNTMRCFYSLSYHGCTKGVPISVTILLEHFDEGIHLGSPDEVLIIATDQDVDIKETINKEVKTKERWAEWSWIVTGPNGWEDFESLTRPVTCTLNGSPLPLGDSKHSSCLLLFYISHSYALHSKLGLSCTDRLVLQGKLSDCLIRISDSDPPLPPLGHGALLDHELAVHSDFPPQDQGEQLLQDVDIKETINKEVKTEERWAVWSWIVTGPNGWEDFESLTRPVTCTLNGSPLPLGDSKHSSCLLLFYISHSYALHSKLGLSCTDRLVLQGKLSDCLIRM
ncbi:hypothetical protein IGI04_040404 [Brassica rapa subsp. trilocularis]|uniref:Uncharacterized protein n=1 Tax=Brassica rapa subsp. trilocularis TaxID=1813537 RepID=A0ABQ7KRX9_BRACM|nr:hypothetical protein IGI04_040404 [Brassica rapa subsp. trilocularis]